MDDWRTEKVLRHLRDRAGPGRPVSVQIFLNENVSVDGLKEHVSRIVTNAQNSAPATTPVEIGKIYSLARSFGLKATPEVIEALASSSSVKDILPSEIDDIYPKPTKSRPAR